MEIKLYPNKKIKFSKNIENYPKLYNYLHQALPRIEFEYNVNNIESIQDVTKDVWLAAIKKSQRNFCFYKNPTREEILEAFKVDPGIIKYMKKEQKTREICADAVDFDVTFFYYVEHEFQTQEMCNKAFNGYIVNFQYIANEYQTQEMCNKAFTKSIYNFQYIAKEYQTQEMCDKIIELECYELFKYFRNDLKTYKMCVDCFAKKVILFSEIPDEIKSCNEIYWDEVFNLNPRIFKDIPENFQNQEMCNKAVDYDKNNFLKVRKDLQTREMCNKAVDFNHIFLKDVRSDLLTIDFCNDFFFKDISYIKFMPEHLHTHEHLQRIIEDNTYYNLIHFVRKDLQTFELCKKLILKTTGCMDYIRDDLKVELFNDKSIDNYSREKLFLYIPKTLQTEDLCIDRLLLTCDSEYSISSKKNSYIEKNFFEEDLTRIINSAFRVFRDDLKLKLFYSNRLKNFCKKTIFVLFEKQIQTLELCWDALKLDVVLFEWVRDDLKTPEMCLYAVQRDGKLLRFIKENQTEDLCIAAVENCVDAIEFIKIQHYLVKNKNDEECMICFENDDKCMIITECNHIFHQMCLDKWLSNTKKNCPVCRSVL